MRAAALIFGPHTHHLDHLGPLSQVMGIPLYITDEEVYEEARRFYPAIDSRFFSPLEVSVALLKEQEVVISCLAKPLIDELFFFAQHALRKTIIPIWCPHGNSDKGHISGFMQYLREEKAALVYGPKMVDFFKEAGAFEGLRAYMMTGNYRLEDYHTHQLFYDRLAETHVHRKLPKAGITYLFAPTWQDSENASSFEGACETLIEKIPHETNLIIKLHPNTRLQDEWKIQQLQDKYSSNPHILFLENYPHIYSLLSLCNLYIGDASSIGYDFLSFDRPMVFLNQRRLDRAKDASAYLFRCGVVIPPQDYVRIYALIKDALPYDHQLFSSIRKEVYDYTFGKQKTTTALREEFANMLQTLSEDLSLM